MRLVYRPDHPKANKNGMVSAEVAGPKNSSNGAAYVISDEMAPLRHMANGKLYTSKAKFRQTTRDHGCIEVGTDSSILKPRKPVQLSREQRAGDIRRAIEQLRGR